MQTSATEELPWLNATTKAGAITEMGKTVASALAKGKRTWKDVEASYKVSGKDRKAVNELAAELMEPIK